MIKTTGIIAGLLITHGPLNFVLSGDMPSFPSFGGRARRSWGSGVSGGGSNRGRSTPDHRGSATDPRGSATDHVNSYYGATPRESRGVPPQQEDYHQNRLVVSIVIYMDSQGVFTNDVIIRGFGKDDTR